MAEVGLPRVRIVVCFRAPNDWEATCLRLDAWYRGSARRAFPERIALVEQRASKPEAVRPLTYQARAMTNRWGSMIAAGRLTLNLDLIRMPTAAIGYVVAHELFTGLSIITDRRSGESWQKPCRIGALVRVVRLANWEVERNDLAVHHVRLPAGSGACLPRGRKIRDAKPGMARCAR